MSDPMKLINKILKDFPLLSAEEEKTLLIETKKGDKKAREKLINSNLRLVISIVKKSCSEEIYNDKVIRVDLIQAGNTGLIKAIDKFDSESSNYKNNKLSTFAFLSIKGAILDHRRAYLSISMKKDDYDDMQKIIDAENDFYKEFGVYPTIEELEKIVGMKEKKIRELKKHDYISFNKPVSIGDKGDTQEFGDSIEDDTMAPPDESQKVFMNKPRSIATLKILNKREQEIIVMRFGLNGQPPMTQIQISKKLGISNERVSQIEQAIQKKMKQALTPPEGETTDKK